MKVFFIIKYPCQPIHRPELVSESMTPKITDLFLLRKKTMGSYVKPDAVKCLRARKASRYFVFVDDQYVFDAICGKLMSRS